MHEILTQYLHRTRFYHLYNSASVFLTASVKVDAQTHCHFRTTTVVVSPNVVLRVFFRRERSSLLIRIMSI